MRFISGLCLCCLAVSLLAGCPQNTKQESADNESAIPATKTEQPGEKPLAVEELPTTPSEDDAPDEPEQAEEPSEPRAESADELEFPPGWPSEIDLYPDARISDCTYQINNQDSFWQVTIKAEAAFLDVALYYYDRVIAAGYKPEDITLTPNNGNGRFTYRKHTLRLNIAPAEDEGETEDTITVHVDIGPRMDEVAMIHNIAFFEVDETPPTWPKEFLPRYPDSWIRFATIAEESFISFEQVTDDPREEVFKHYDTHFIDYGLELLETRTAPAGEEGEKYTYDEMHQFDGKYECRLSTRIDEDGKTVIMISSDLKRRPDLSEGMKWLLESEEQPDDAAAETP